MKKINISESKKRKIKKGLKIFGIILLYILVIIGLNAITNFFTYHDFLISYNFKNDENHGFGNIIVNLNRREISSKRLKEFEKHIKIEIFKDYENTNVVVLNIERLGKF